MLLQIAVCFGKHGKVGLAQSRTSFVTLAGSAQLFYFQETLPLWAEAWLSGYLYLLFPSGREEPRLDSWRFFFFFFLSFSVLHLGNLDLRISSSGVTALVLSLEAGPCAALSVPDSGR